MVLRKEATLSENDNGASLYVSPKLLDDRLCPLTGDETVVTHVVPHSGLVVLPSVPDYPLRLTIRDPDRIASEPPAALTEDRPHE